MGDGTKGGDPSDDAGGVKGEGKDEERGEGEDESSAMREGVYTGTGFRTAFFCPPGLAWMGAGITGEINAGGASGFSVVESTEGRLGCA